MGLADASKRFLPLVEADLRQVLTIPHPDMAPYYGMMHYHQGWVDDMLQPPRSASRPGLAVVAQGGSPRTGGTGPAKASGTGPAEASGTGPEKASSTGKRLRPLLCLLACEAAGGSVAGYPGRQCRRADPQLFAHPRRHRGQQSVAAWAAGSVERLGCAACHQRRGWPVCAGPPGAAPPGRPGGAGPALPGGRSGLRPGVSGPV
jgi:hypothetical protein